MKSMITLLALIAKSEFVLESVPAIIVKLEEKPLM